MYFIPSTVDLFVSESPQNREEGEFDSKEQCFSGETLRDNIRSTSYWFCIELRPALNIF